MKIKNELALKNGKMTFRLAWLRCRKLKAIPRFVFTPTERAKILKFYIEAQQLNLSQRGKWEVDHIIPLSNPYVCGLHCSANLQILSRTRNCNKSNEFTCYREVDGKKYYYRDLNYVSEHQKVRRNFNQTKKNPLKTAKKRSKRVGTRLKTVKTCLKRLKKGKK